MSIFKHILTGGIVAATLLAGGPARAMEGGEYVGTVNHVFDEDTLRIAHRYGGQIQVRVMGLEGAREPVTLDDLMGRTVRVTDARWREGFLEGRVEVEGIN